VQAITPRLGWVSFLNLNKKKTATLMGGEAEFPKCEILGFKKVVKVNF
jgi:hypothetical protein